MKTEGFALVTALSFVIIIGVVVGTALYLSATNRRLSAETVRTTQAQYAAEAGIERAAQLYWTKLWMNAPASNPRTLKAYQVLLSSVLAKNATATKTSNPLLTDTINGNTFDVSVSRTDTSGTTQSTQLLVRSRGTAADGTSTRVLTQTLRIAPRNYAGLQYALLSNNVNCTFCHTKIETMESAYGSGNAANGKDRVKVGTLESLELRVDGGRDSYWDAVDTAINGTLYTRGTVIDQDRKTYALGSTNDIRFTASDNGGKVVYDNTKNTDQNTQLASSSNSQDCAASGVTCTANKGFYQNYPGGSGPDGDLPNSFPQPVPDSPGSTPDRFTSNQEWADYISDTRAEEGDPGTLSVSGAGSSMQFKGTSVSDANQVRTVSGTAANFTNISSTAGKDDASRGLPGNLKISGNMTIDGTVFVDGDVMISGRLSGTGKIIARGNIYVTGDIEYNCGSGGSVVDCDYSNTANLPQLALISGGNTLVGDYLSTTWTTAADLRDSSKLEPGFPANFNTNTGLSYVAAEIANFNKLEYSKAAANSSYVPRFYRMRPGDPIIRYTGEGENATNYNTGQLKGVGVDISCAGNACTKATTTNTTDLAIYNRARVLDLSPADNWMTESQVKQTWIDNIETPTRPKARAPINTSKNKPLQLDATIYTNNAAFALARGCQNVGPCDAANMRSKLQGRMVMNGSLIAADSGVLSPGEDGKTSLFTTGEREVGLRIHYDSRIQNLISLGKSDVVNMSRSDFQLKGQ